MKKICIVLGTRPEIIKLFPVVHGLKGKAKVVLIHTGQHYDKVMSQSHLDMFKLKVDYLIKSKSKDSSTQIYKMMQGVDDVLKKIKPDAVVVQGDTNSTMIGAICAKKNGMRLYHIEAGARCFDKKVPEEQNRIIADHLSDRNFCYDDESKMNLHREGITKNVTKFCNTAYGAVDYINKNKLKSKKSHNHILVTIHRAENTNNPEILKRIIAALGGLKEKLIFPIHPRTRKVIEKYNIPVSSNIELIGPLEYVDFLGNLKSSKCVLTDSGGVVDECVYFNTPLIVLRDKTERNDLVKRGKILLLSPKEVEFEKKLIKLVASGFQGMKRVKVSFRADVGDQIAKSIMKDLS